MKVGMGHWWKLEYSKKNLFQYHFVYHKPYVWSIPVLHCERPATKALSHGTAFYIYIQSYSK